MNQTSFLSQSTSEIRGSLVLPKMFKAYSNILLTVPRCSIFCGSFLLFVFVCHSVLSVPCSLLVTCWESSDRLAPLYGMFSCVFVSFPYGVLVHEWYLIESITDLCFFPCLIRQKHGCQGAWPVYLTYLCTNITSFKDPWCIYVKLS